MIGTEPVTKHTETASVQRPDLGIYPYTAGDASKMLTLAQEALGSTIATPMTPAFWQWKHHANTFGESYGIYSKDEHQSRVAGMRILMRWQFTSSHGRCILAARAVDTATHPDYQRLGIFSTLTRQAIKDLAQEGVHTIYNTPNQQSLPGYLKMGWRVVATWPLYMKALRPWRMMIRQIRKHATTPALDFAAYFRPPIMTWAEFSERYRDEVAGLIPSWEAERPRRGLRTPRTFDYLNWRYGQHPAIQYGVFAEVGASGRLEAFVILRPNLRYGWQEVVVTELFLAEPSVKRASAVLHKVAGQINGDYLIAHFGAETLEEQALRRSGFLRVPRRGIVFTVRTLQEGLEDLYEPGNWDLSLGDLEVF